jgi:aminoglycoside phosphotransferase (APT) family kinase protein
MTRGDGSRPVERYDRIQTATRDMEHTRDHLERWLATRLPAGASPRLSELEAPAANGLSSETLLFEATWTQDGTQRHHRLAARVAPDPANLPVFPIYDLTAQFLLLEALGEIGTVPVPGVWWSEPDAAVLGAPFFIMDRVDGQVPPDVMPYNFGSWLSEATHEEQRRVQTSSIEVLAAIHAIPDPPERLPFLPGGDDRSALRAHVNRQRVYYEWVAQGTPSPLIERGFDWLEAHWPAEEGPAVLCWGDARIGNIVYRDFEPVAVLDWEMAALGPREIDVAWFIFLHRFFEDIALAYDLPAMPHFLRRDDVVATYEEASGEALRNMDFFLVEAALRQAIIMSRTQRRQVHFGEATMPDDVDDTILHRASLERLLDGTYWDAVS